MRKKRKKPPNQSLSRTDVLATVETGTDERLTTKQHQNTLQRSIGHIGRNIELGVYYLSGWAVEYGLIKILKLFVVPHEGGSFAWVSGAYEWAEVGAGLLSALVFFLHVVINAFTQMRRELSSERGNEDDER